MIDPIHMAKFTTYYGIAPFDLHKKITYHKQERHSIYTQYIVATYRTLICIV